MPKPLELTLDTMIPAPMPQAAQPPAAAAERPVQRGREATKAEPKEPMQVRWPGDEVKAARLAALQLDFSTVSEFMLACFHAYMQNSAKRESTNATPSKA